jgi:hypothetical protein
MAVLQQLYEEPHEHVHSMTVLQQLYEEPHEHVHSMAVLQQLYEEPHEHVHSMAVLQQLYEELHAFQAMKVMRCRSTARSNFGAKTVDEFTEYTNTTRLKAAKMVSNKNVLVSHGYG